MPHRHLLIAVAVLTAVALLPSVTAAHASTTRSFFAPMDAVVHCYETDAYGQLVGGSKGTVYTVDGQLSVTLPPAVVTAQCTDFAFNEGPVLVTAAFADGRTQTSRIGLGQTQSFFQQADAADLAQIQSLTFAVQH